MRQASRPHIQHSFTHALTHDTIHGMNDTHTQFINALEVDAQPIFEDDQNLKVRVGPVEDGSGQDIHARIDLRWVSVNDAINAIQNTFLVDLMYGQVEDKMDLIDCLVTRSTDANEIVFCVLAEGKEFTIKAGERFRA